MSESRTWVGVGAFFPSKYHHANGWLGFFSPFGAHVSHACSCALRVCVRVARHKTCGVTVTPIRFGDLIPNQNSKTDDIFPSPPLPSTGKLGDPTQTATDAAKHASDFTRSMWEEVKHEASELSRKQAGKKL